MPSYEYSPFIQKVLRSVATEVALPYLRGECALNDEIDWSDPNQIKTAADHAIGLALIEFIIDRYPNHRIIDEEAGCVEASKGWDGEHIWFTDPIDGTANFATSVGNTHGPVGLWGIMLGLARRSEMIAGGVILPGISQLYFAEQGRGAYCNDDCISVNQGRTIPKTLFAYFLDIQREDMETSLRESQLQAEVGAPFLSLRNSNSIFDTMMVANGSYGGSMCFWAKCWDHVPDIIIREAGGNYTSWDGSFIDFSQFWGKQDGFTPFVCGAPQVHRVVVEKIRQFQHLVPEQFRRGTT